MIKLRALTLEIQLLLKSWSMQHSSCCFLSNLYQYVKNINSCRMLIECHIWRNTFVIYWNWTVAKILKNATHLYNLLNDLLQKVIRISLSRVTEIYIFNNCFALFLEIELKQKSWYMLHSSVGQFISEYKQHQFMLSSNWIGSVSLPTIYHLKRLH